MSLLGPLLEQHCPASRSQSLNRGQPSTPTAPQGQQGNTGAGSHCTALQAGPAAPALGTSRQHSNAAPERLRRAEKDRKLGTGAAGTGPRAGAFCGHGRPWALPVTATGRGESLHFAGRPLEGSCCRVAFGVHQEIQRGLSNSPQGAGGPWGWAAQVECRTGGPLTMGPATEPGPWAWVSSQTLIFINKFRSHKEETQLALH